jgi:hypothetical protein
MYPPVLDAYAKMEGEFKLPTVFCNGGGDIGLLCRNSSMLICDGVVWSGLIWLGTGTGGELLRMIGNCRVAAQAVAPRAVLSYVELGSLVVYAILKYRTDNGMAAVVIL